MEFFSDNSGMREVAEDDWADWTSNFMVYHTENIRGSYSVMYSRLSSRGGYANCGYVVAEVHYAPSGEKAYFVR